MDDHPQVTIVIQNLIFYNTPLWMIIKICLIKTLLGKTLWEKPQWRKKSTIFFWIIIAALLKTLPIKPNGTKPGQRKKECSISILSFSPSCKHDYDFFNISNGGSLNLYIPKSYLNFFNLVEGNAFVNRPARLLHTQIYWTSVSSCFWSSWV